MEPLEIIERFAEYIGYSREQRKFNVYTRVFRITPALDRVPGVNEYDPTGSLALLYVKRAFKDELEGSQISLFDAIAHPHYLESDRQMWELFCSDDVTEIERRLASSVSDFYSSVIGTPLIGDERVVLDDMSGLVESVVDGLRKCHLHVWLAGSSPVSRPENICSNVLVYPSLRDALMCLSDMVDGLYLCYVKQKRSPDGFFGFFVKSGDTIVSVDDAIFEIYPGQHGNLRNGRYLDAKSFELFPYSEMVTFDKPDYKGWYTEYSVDYSAVPITSFDDKMFLPLSLAMSCVLGLVEGKSYPTGCQVYVDSLMPHRLALEPPETRALIVRDAPALVKANAGLTFDDITTETVKNGELPGLPETLANRFINDDCVSGFIECFAEGFDLDAGALLGYGNQQAGGDSVEPTEFFAHAEKFRQIAFCQGRQQLADRLSKNLDAELAAFGGIAGVSQWYADMLESSRDKISRLCAMYYREVPERCEGGYYKNSKIEELSRFTRIDKPVADIVDCIPLNRYEGFTSWSAYYRSAETLANRFGGTLPDWVKPLVVEPSIHTIPNYAHVQQVKALLSESGQRCKIIYEFSPQNSEDIARLFGVDIEDLPPIVRYWACSGPVFDRFGDNPLLQVVDPVRKVYNPMTVRSTSIWYHNTNGYKFRFQLGFTKREMTKLVKSLD